MIDVEINRAEWDVRPNKKFFNIPGNSGCLLRDESEGNLKCCLGFLALQGTTLTEYDILDKNEPQDVSNTNSDGEYEKYWPKGLRKNETKLMKINDDFLFTNEQREVNLKIAGVDAGINFIFTGEYLTKKGGKW